PVPIPAIAFRLPDMVHGLVARLGRQARLQTFVKVGDADALLVDLVAFRIFVEEIPPEGTPEEFDRKRIFRIGHDLMGLAEWSYVAGILGPDHHLLIGGRR